MLVMLQQFIYGAMPIGLRVAGLLTFAPFWGSLSITPRVKVGLVFFLTVFLYPLAAAPVAGYSIVSWAKMALTEAVLGLGFGLCLQFIFEAALMAGALAGFQFSFSLVNVIDPNTSVDTPVLSNFYQLVALLLFLQMNVHHWVLRAIVKSFEYLPIGTAEVSRADVAGLFHAASAMWLVGVQIATPVLLATMLIDVTVGFLSKASPQLPAIVLSIPLKSMMGYGVLAISVALWPVIFETQFARALGWSEQLLHLAH